MSFRDVQNPGIGGIDELTTAEELVIQTVASLTGNSTKVLRVNAGETAVEWSSLPLNTIISTTGGTTVLTASQNISTSIEITGTLTSNAVIVVADTMAPFVAENITSGAYTLTFKTAAGTGVVVAQGVTELLYANGTNVEVTATGGTGAGTVTSVSVTTANGVSGTVATATTTPAITLTLGAITPTSVNALTLASQAVGFTIAGGTTSKTLTVSNTLTLAGTDTSTLNIGTGGTLGTAAFTAATAYAAALSGTINEIAYFNSATTIASLAVATYPSLTEISYVKGVTSAIQTQIGTKAPSTAPTFATSITGSYLTASEMLITDGSKNIVSAPVATYPSLTELTYVKGLTSAIQTQLGGKQATITFGTGVQTALGVNIGSAGAPVLFDGALGTPSSGTLTNCTGLPVNGIVDDTTSALGVGTLELGHASDTTLSRVSAGVIAVEGNNVITANIVASPTVSGVVELATTAEIDTGTDSTRAMPVDQFVASARNVRYIDFYLVDSATDLTVGTGKGGNFECPFTGTITAVGAYVNTAGTTNASVIDINKAGTTIMTTNKLSIDSAEVSTRTAATAPTLTTTAITAGDLISFDIDSLSTTAPKGLHVRMEIRLS